MRKMLLTAACIAAAGLGACTDRPDDVALFEQEFGDAVVTVSGDPAGDMVAEVVAGGAEVATLDWSGSASRGTLALDGRGFEVAFEAPASIAPQRLAELAHQLWRGGPGQSQVSGGLCVGGPGWECCLKWPEIFVCRQY